MGQFTPSRRGSGPAALTTRSPKDDWHSDRVFRAAFDHAAIGMAVVSASGHLLATNPALTRFVGCPEADLVGRHFADLTHPDDVGVFEEWAGSVVEGDGDSGSLEVRYLHRDGYTVWGRVTVAPVRDETGVLTQVVAEIEDVSARRRAEAAARESEERFRLAFDSAASGMALVDPATGRFLEMNRAGCEMLRYTEQEILGLTIQDVTAVEDRESSIARFRKVITGEVPSSRAELRYVRGDGTTAVAMISTALVHDDDGRPRHLVANVIDITEQVEAQERLRQLLDSKDRLIASVSHELRTPLTAVLGFAEFLRDSEDLLSPDERSELVESIAGQTADLGYIVEDLLVAARAADDILVVTELPIDLHAEAVRVLEALRHSAHAGRARLTGTSAQGTGDPARVRQILRNLVSNAFRYGGEDVEVSTRVDGGRACVCVRDNGPGVPVEDRELIFEPYQRSGSGSGNTASIGLGLTVSRKLARLMGGDLTYRFENDRSVFELSLPIADGG